MSNVSALRPGLLNAGLARKELSSYTPVPSSADEANTPVVVRVSASGQLPEQDLARFTQVNPLAETIDKKDSLVLNFAKGFRTIEDYITYLASPDSVKTEPICGAVHDLSAPTAALVTLQSTIGRDTQNKPVVDLTQVLEVLHANGFCRLGVLNSALHYVKFNDKNLPHEFVDINLYASRRSKILVGHVSHKTSELLEEAFAPSQEKFLEPLTLEQLDGYIQPYPQAPFRGEFNTLELTSDMDFSLPEFYPWIKMGLHEYFAEFLNSRANVLVLIGPPGTGKSTLIRTMVRDLNVRAMLAYKPDVVASEHFIKTCQTFLSNDYDARSHYHARMSGQPLSTERRHKAIVVEDADLIMSKRSDGNHRMSEILNATCGIASDTHSKFILSTNLKDADDIDPALLRPGRCFDILCFRDLSAAEATTVRAVRGLAPREFALGRRYKLAEALNDSLTHHQVEPVVKPRFGF